MNGLSDVYFFGSDIMLLAPFSGEEREAGNSREESRNEATEHKLSNLEGVVELDDDVYEIVPVDPFASCNSFGESHHQIPYSYVTEGQQVNDGLAVLEILYNHSMDAPEYIDINDLAKVRGVKDHLGIAEPKPVATVEEDDDDVIFVAEYNKADGPSTSKEPARESGPQPRRNPVRKARRNARDLTKDLLYDEDYALLESSSEEEIINDTLKKSVRSSGVHSLREFKKWPVNGLHERPEYNDSTKQLEKFDYTIRQIKNSVAPKKALPKINRKPIKRRKYFPRRKAPVKVEVQEKVPVSELQDIVESTLQDVRSFIDNIRMGNEILERNKKKRNEERKLCENDKENVGFYPDSNVCSADLTETPERLERNGSKNKKINENILKSLELLKTQAVLFQVVNCSSEKNVMKYFKKVEE